MRKLLRPQRTAALFCAQVGLWLITSSLGNANEVVNPPILLTEANSTRAIALNAYDYRAEPFPVMVSPPVGPDSVNRILLFAKNVRDLQGDLSVLSADAEDATGRHYSLTVERVDPIPGNEWLSSILVRLNESMNANLGDVLVKITLRGVASNRVRVAIGRVGGGKPDDESDYSMPYVLEFDGSPQTVDYGLYWPPNTDLGKFFWEFWAMPGQNTDSRYLLTDGYGGAHSILFGFFRVVELEHYSLYGNIYDGTNITVFASDDGPAPMEWGHFAVGWDGRYVITYFNGVPVGRALFTGPRRSPGMDMGGGRLLIGGSDHNNLIGRIAQVRGYEGADLLQQLTGEKRTTSAFVPDTFFGLTSVNGGPNCTLLSRFLRPSNLRVAWVSRSGVAISGNNLTKTGPAGWNGGASSALSLTSGEGYAEFTVQENGTRKAFGFTNADTSFVPGEMDYSIFLEYTGQVAILVNRTLVGFIESYVPGDRFRISVSPNAVRFFKNGVLFYTSTTSPHYPLRVDASIYHTGGIITDANIGGTLSPVTQPGEVPDLAGGLVGRIRGVGLGLGDPTQTFPLPTFISDPNVPNAVSMSGEGTPPGRVPIPLVPPNDALVFDSFSRRSSTYAFDGIGGLGSVEAGVDQTGPWRFEGPNPSTYGPTRFGILNGKAVILSNGPGIAWLPLGPSSQNVDVRADRLAGAFGSGLDTGSCFRVVDGRNFFFAYTSGGDDDPASRRVLSVGYWLNGTQTRLVSGIAMPDRWTTLRVVAKSDGNITVYADALQVYTTNSTVLTIGRGAGLYNDHTGMGLTNRWDNFTVLPAQ